MLLTMWLHRGKHLSRYPGRTGEREGLSEGPCWPWEIVEMLGIPVETDAGQKQWWLGSSKCLELGVSFGVWPCLAMATMTMLDTADIGLRPAGKCSVEDSSEKCGCFEKLAWTILEADTLSFQHWKLEM